MKKIIFSFFRALSLSFLVVHSIAQTPTIDHSTEIAAKSKLWSTSYNSRDSLSFYTLFDTAAILISAGGKWIGLEKCKELCRSLYKKRPDIIWDNLQEKIEVNEQWLIAYETGRW
ncbi:MAG TPA: nuclear transport factor 2 family protein, partial [Puia sp.]|nr:nuclear transport factor 2 family protein [Puia sp.]